MNLEIYVMGASPHVCRQANSCWLLKVMYMFFVSHFVCGTYSFHLPSSGTNLNNKLFNRFIVKWGAVLSLLVVRLAWLIKLFLVNIIFIDILRTEEQGLFFLACVIAILNSLSIGSIVWSSGGSYLIFVLLRNAVLILLSMDLCHKMHLGGPCTIWSRGHIKVWQWHSLFLFPCILLTSELWPFIM